jgi:hypothetical protein
MKKGLMQMMKNQRQREVTAAAATATPEDQSFDYGEEEEEEQEGGSPQRRKRRKLLKSFREYTTANEEEGRFKGWSVRAGEDMGEYMERWGAPQLVSRRQLFWMAYRETYKQKQERLGKKKKPAAAQPNPPNYQKKVWGFQDLPDQIEQI